MLRNVIEILSKKKKNHYIFCFSLKQDRRSASISVPVFLILPLSQQQPTLRVFFPTLTTAVFMNVCIASGYYFLHDDFLPIIF